MTRNKVLLAALLGLTMLAGCNESNSPVDTADTSGTFTECKGTVVDGVCLKTPDPVVCEAGSTLVGGECVKTPVVCETGSTLVDDVCVKTPVPVVCENGSSLVDGVCKKPDPIKCEKGIVLVDGICKTPDPVVCGICKTPDPIVCESGSSLVDGICKAPDPVVCAAGSTLIGTQCIKDPIVCETGTTLVDGICKTPDPVVCEAGSTLVGGECVKPPVVCESGSSLVGGQCVKDPIVCESGSTKVGDVCVRTPDRDPANLDNGMTSLTWNGFTATITADPATLAPRTYQLTTTQPGRAARPPNRPAAERTTATGGTLNITERPEQPVIRTGSPMFDGLFALALQEAVGLTSTTIRDGAYNGGAAIPCGGTVGCYRTGTLWSYVWTRDTAYAVDLGLAQINPRVARNSLLFKLSQRRDLAPRAGPGPDATPGPETAPGVPDSTEIVQDTGSGGSWPISTDRVVWARAAFEVLKYLDGAERTEFLGRAFAAIRNTVENDRFAVYDSRDGLYRGESSFTDWREQTYPGWTANTVVHIAMSKTLSTNVNFWKILDVAASMATDLNRPLDAARYRGWADNLRTAINRELWLSDRGLYSMMKTTELDQLPVSRYELLGETLAILDGIAGANDDKAAVAKILQNYPHTSAGAAVVWPQMRNLTPDVYHNKAIWPFVSSYLIKAAAKGRNANVVNRNFATLINGAALNLSNMENFQFDTLSPDTPDINSEMQLWSVGGYIGSVLDVVFGRDTTMQGIRFEPFITKQMHINVFNGARQLQLNNLDYRGRIITVKVNLPAAGALTDGYYTANTVSLNGAPIDLTAYTPPSALKSGEPNVFVINLINNTENGGSARVVSADNDLYGPDPVNLTSPQGGGIVARRFGIMGLGWATGTTPTGTAVNIYRNGTRVATGLTGISWRDLTGETINNQALCYTAERYYSPLTELSNVSQRTNPSCYWGEDADGDNTPDRLRFINTDNATNVEGTDSSAERKTDHGRVHLADWGVLGDVLTFTFTPATGGTYDILLRYGNAFGPVNTGVSAAVKRMEVSATNQTTRRGVVVMPHLPDWDTWGESSVLQVTLTAGTAYTVSIRDYYNMSYLASNATYVIGNPPEVGVVNRANIAELILRRMTD